MGTLHPVDLAHGIADPHVEILQQHLACVAKVMVLNTVMKYMGRVLLTITVYVGCTLGMHSGDNDADTDGGGDD